MVYNVNKDAKVIVIYNEEDCKKIFPQYREYTDSFHRNFCQGIKYMYSAKFYSSKQ